MGRRAPGKLISAASLGGEPSWGNLILGLGGQYAWVGLISVANLGGAICEPRPGKGCKRWHERRERNARAWFTRAAHPHHATHNLRAPGIRPFSRHRNKPVDHQTLGSWNGAIIDVTKQRRTRQRTNTLATLWTRVRSRNDRNGKEANNSETMRGLCIQRS